MRIIYMGTPEFSVKPLIKLIEAGHEIITVVTQPDRPKGRKMVLTSPPLKDFAQEKGLNVLQFEKIRNEGVDVLRRLNPDIIITAAYGQILSQEILDIPKYGVLNIHASLLPKYRGASPIQAAIMNGDKVTGVTIMQTDIGIDTGDTLLSACLDIEPNDNTASLTEKLSSLGADLIIEALRLLEKGEIKPQPQEDGVTHCRVIKKQDTLINWSKEKACDIHNKIRAFSPAMGGLTELDGLPFKIRETTIDEGNFGIPTDGTVCGTVVVKGERIFVICGSGVVEVVKLQPAGKKIMTASEYLRGNDLGSGKVFG